MSKPLLLDEWPYPLLTVNIRALVICNTLRQLETFFTVSTVLSILFSSLGVFPFPPPRSASLGRTFDSLDTSKGLPPNVLDKPYRINCAPLMEPCRARDSAFIGSTVSCGANSCTYTFLLHKLLYRICLQCSQRSIRIGAKISRRCVPCALGISNTLLNYRSPAKSISQVHLSLGLKTRKSQGKGFCTAQQPTLYSVTCKKHFR